jgi:hypothetical protein
MKFLKLFFPASARKPSLATVSNNETPRAIAESITLGAKIRSAVFDRELIIKSDPRIDPDFAMPAANWHSPDNDHLNSYRLLSSLNWSEIRLLRFRAQNFTGKNLVIMDDGRGTSGSGQIPDNFETRWTEEKRQVVLNHWSALTKRLPRSLILDAPNMLGETGWWIDGKIVNVDVIDYQERINLLRLAGLFDRFANRSPRILEIGGGYGALARALVKIMAPSQYVICDLPESLLFSGLYLSLTGAAKMRLASIADTLTPLHRGEICLLPNYLAETLIAGQRFDLVINTLWLSEMSPLQVKTYAGLISKAIGHAGVFFEQNHDNRHLGLIDCREYLASFFRSETRIDPRDMPTTRGEAIIWSN